MTGRRVDRSDAVGANGDRADAMTVWVNDDLRGFQGAQGICAGVGAPRRGGLLCAAKNKAPDMDIKVAANGHAVGQSHVADAP